MATTLTTNGSSTFRIKRPLTTTNGFVSDVDPIVKSHLDELNALLGRRIFEREAFSDEVDVEVDANAGVKKARRSTPPKLVLYDVFTILESHLSPKQVPDTWASESLARRLHDAVESQNRITLSEYIDLTPELSSLKYAYQSYFSANRYGLAYNTRTVLEEYPAIVDYLLAYGYHIMGFTEINGLTNFVMSNRSGAHNVADYAAVSAARTVIQRDRLRVHDYNHDDSPIVNHIKEANLPLSTASFKTKLHAVINDYIFNKSYADMIEAAHIGTIPPGMLPLLIKYVKNFEKTVPITPDNIKFFLPLFISQIKGEGQVEDPSEVDIAEADKDFDVDFFQDDSSLIQVSASAVKCAAQLYYSMILGDELAVFDCVNFFTHRFLLRGGIEIQDARLRDDLQQYVFSNRFTDLKTGQIIDRTRPAERHMFYKQVFDYGQGQVARDLIVNHEFTRNWKVLILESAKFIERAQAAFNPGSYVSKQNVMQAVEDLQYNLSTSSTGMVNVISPMIYAELNFIVQRIFMHPEVLRQVVPAGGTWWKVVETLYMGMNNTRPKSTVLYNKAKLGHDIIRSVADYNPATFEDDAVFSAFISNVDAFITTQSILQEALADDIGEEQVEGDDDSYRPSAKASNGYGNGSQTNGVPAGAATGGGNQDEWDF